MIRLAKLDGISPDIALIDLARWRAEREDNAPEIVAIYNSIGSILRRASANLVVVFWVLTALLVGTGTAAAAPISASESRIMYIMELIAYSI